MGTKLRKGRADGQRDGGRPGGRGGPGPQRSAWPGHHPGGGPGRLPVPGPVRRAGHRPGHAGPGPGPGPAAGLARRVDLARPARAHPGHRGRHPGPDPVPLPRPLARAARRPEVRPHAAVRAGPARAARADPARPGSAPAGPGPGGGGRGTPHRPGPVPHRRRALRRAGPPLRGDHAGEAARDRGPGRCALRLCRQGGQTAGDHRHQRGGPADRASPEPGRARPGPAVRLGTRRDLAPAALARRQPLHRRPGRGPLHGQGVPDLERHRADGPAAGRGRARAGPGRPGPPAGHHRQRQGRGRLARRHSHRGPFVLHRPPAHRPLRDRRPAADDPGRPGRAARRRRGRGRRPGPAGGGGGVGVGGGVG